MQKKRSLRTSRGGTKHCDATPCNTEAHYAVLCCTDQDNAAQYRNEKYYTVLRCTDIFYTAPCRAEKDYAVLRRAGQHHVAQCRTKRVRSESDTNTRQKQKRKRYKNVAAMDNARNVVLSHTETYCIALTNTMHHNTVLKQLRRTMPY